MLTHDSPRSCLYGFSTFIVVIVKALGYSTINSQLLTAPIYAWAAIVYLVSAHICDKKDVRYWLILPLGIVTCIGYILLVAVQHSTAVSLFACFLCGSEFILLFLRYQLCFSHSALCVLLRVPLPYPRDLLSFAPVPQLESTPPSASTSPGSTATSLVRSATCAALAFPSALLLSHLPRRSRFPTPFAAPADVLSAGVRKRSTAIGIQQLIGNIGGVIAGQIVSSVTCEGQPRTLTLALLSTARKTSRTTASGTPSHSARWSGASS